MDHIVLLDNIKGVTPKIKQALSNINIRTTYDLISYLPMKYETYELNTISYSNHNTVITIKGKIVGPLTLNQYTKVSGVSFQVESSDDLIEVIAFNQVFLMRTFKADDEVYIKGKFNFARKQIIANKVMKDSSYEEFKPKYNIEGVLDYHISKIIKAIFDNNMVKIYEKIPNHILSKYQLTSRKNAFKNIHLANNLKEYHQGIKYMKYEEAYLFQKKLLESINKRVSRDPKKYDLEVIKEFIKTIPFELTQDQKDTVNDIFRDFKKNEITYRLIQGDVGSGKTIVAIIAILGVITAEEQVAFMVPTELLAKQHFKNISQLLQNYNVNIRLLTGSSKDKSLVKEEIKNNKVDLVIGTHALIEDDVTFNNLGLIIIDEQHKFGVKTRDQLVKKSINSDLLYLTATPIPRTLAISLFGDADISIIKEKPLGRKDVLTKYINDEDLSIVFDEINKTIERNEKVYIIVPAVTSVHAKYNLENTYELIKENIKTDKINYISGKTKRREQDEIINNFINEDRSILIATTMIEVGIDVKDATLMVILSADYFGLSQLHQLRGRVGRSSLESKCLLVSSKEIKERLEIMEKVNDGFILSEYDLKLRGPGSLLGFEQSGLADFKFLDFVTDFNILKNMRIELNKIQK